MAGVPMMPYLPIRGTCAQAAGILPSNALHALLDSSISIGPAAQEVDGPEQAQVFLNHSPVLLSFSSPHAGLFLGGWQGELC